MKPFSPVTEAELVRARRDPAFRQQLLTHNLEVLLAKLQSQRQSPQSAGATAAQMQEGVALAVRLAELIQITSAMPRGS
jgi:hypothetical protein